MTGKNKEDSECIVHDHPVDPAELWRYSVERDAYSEADISRYVELQASPEVVKHVERIKKEIILGDAYEIWDVTTDKDRWWVLTNLTNLYSQKHFPSLDYTLSFHIGLMTRLKSRQGGADALTPFEEVIRRMDQADTKLESSIESEDFQAVGMILREALITLVVTIRNETTLPEALVEPQSSNFIEWSEILMNHICSGNRRKELRQHLKHMSKETWQLVNWLTHARNATGTAASIATHSCQTVVGHFLQVTEKSITEQRECPICKSRNIRNHYDHNIGDDGVSFYSCGECDWSDHPDKNDTRLAPSGT